MPRVAIPPSRDLATLFRERRRQLKLTLRDAQDRTKEFGKVIPFTTLAKVEQGRVDPGVIRFQQILQVYDIEPEMALDLVAVESYRGHIPKGVSPQALYHEGERLWKAGDYSRALGYVYGLREATAERSQFVEIRQKGELLFAVLAADMGRYQLAKYLLEKLLREPLPSGLLLRCLIHLARCWERLGVQELALAVLTRAEVHTKELSPAEGAWLAHQRALIELARGFHGEAREHLAAARKLYKTAGKDDGVLKADVTLTRLLLATGEAKQALQTAQQVVLAAASRPAFLPETQVLLGHAQLANRQTDKAIATLRRALGDAIAEDAPSARFLAHHYLAQAYAAAGDGERSSAEQTAAEQFRKHVDYVPDPVVFEGGTRDAHPAVRRIDQRKRRRRRRPQPG